MGLMITDDEVKKLASLSRLELTDKEKDAFPKEIESILGYVGHIDSLTATQNSAKFDIENVLREDEVIHRKEEYTKGLISNAPVKEGNYVKVKKILG
jgi:aspartyl-tRNA(Asn)/glutamyl-tRNA(Gln) amidotransferase subunit C